MIASLRPSLVHERAEPYGPSRYGTRATKMRHTRGQLCDSSRQESPALRVIPALRDFSSGVATRGWRPQSPTHIRIGNEHPDSLITYPDAHNLSGCAQPIRISPKQREPRASRRTSTTAHPYRLTERSAGTRRLLSLGRPQGPTAPGNPVVQPAGTPLIRRDLVDEQIGPDTCVRYRARLRL